MTKPFGFIESKNLQNNDFHSVADEHSKAINKFSKFNSSHEGYAVIKEELDELWDIIKCKNYYPECAQDDMKKECIQIAAMALRFIKDICE
jgi:hypothetical protein